MFKNLRDWWRQDDVLVGFIKVMGSVALFAIAFVGIFVAIIWWCLSPSIVNLGHGAEVRIPGGVYTSDDDQEKFGYFVESGCNVTVTNNGDKELTLTVSFQQPGVSILYDHAFENLPPGKSLSFGAEYPKFAGMYLGVSEGAWKH